MLKQEDAYVTEQKTIAMSSKSEECKQLALCRMKSLIKNVMHWSKLEIWKIENLLPNDIHHRIWLIWRVSCLLKKKLIKFLLIHLSPYSKVHLIIKISTTKKKLWMLIQKQTCPKTCLLKKEKFYRKMRDIAKRWSRNQNKRTKKKMRSIIRNIKLTTSLDW